MKYIDMKTVKHVENTGDILACKYYHSFAYPDGIEAVGDCGAQKVDNKPWDVFHVQYETKDAYYGTPMLGLGLVNCMILKSDTRPFTDDELNYKVGMFGCHTGKSILKYNVEIKPIVNKL